MSGHHSQVSSSSSSNGSGGGSGGGGGLARWAGAGVAAAGSNRMVKHMHKVGAAAIELLVLLQTLEIQEQQQMWQQQLGQQGGCMPG
jgi:hypothetical protein